MKRILDRLAYFTAGLVVGGLIMALVMPGSKETGARYNYNPKTRQLEKKQ